MASAAFSGVGTVLSKKVGAVYVPLAEINDIDGPNMSKGTIDVTSLDSTGGYMEFMGGFRNPGSLVLNMNFTKVAYGLMKEDFDSDNMLNDYRVVLPDASNTTFDFKGYVSDLGMAVPHDDKVTATATITISGTVTMTS